MHSAALLQPSMRDEDMHIRAAAANPSQQLLWNFTPGMRAYSCFALHTCEHIEWCVFRRLRASSNDYLRMPKRRNAMTPLVMHLICVGVNATGGNWGCICLVSVPKTSRRCGGVRATLRRCVCWTANQHLVSQGPHLRIKPRLSAPHRCIE